MSTTITLTRKEREVLVSQIVSVLSCHTIMSSTDATAVRRWRKAAPGYVEKELKYFPDDKPADVQDFKEQLDGLADILEKIQRVKKRQIQVVYNIPPETEAAMRKTARMMNIPFKEFFEVNADVGHVFRCAAEDIGLTTADYAWPSRAAAQKAANQIIAAFPGYIPLTLYFIDSSGECVKGEFTAQAQEASP